MSWIFFLINVIKYIDKININRHAESIKIFIFFHLTFYNLSVAQSTSVECLGKQFVNHAIQRLIIFY
nr:MAG TPA: hypothetical protein [Caudoviricetes sp.]